MNISDVLSNKVEHLCYQNGYSYVKRMKIKTLFCLFSFNYKRLFLHESISRHSDSFQRP